MREKTSSMHYMYYVQEFTAHKSRKGGNTRKVVLLLNTNSALNTLETGTYIQTYQSETGTDHCASDRSRRSSSRFRCYRWWRLCDGGPVCSPARPRSSTRRCRKTRWWRDTVSRTVGADRRRCRSRSQRSTRRWRPADRCWHCSTGLYTPEWMHTDGYVTCLARHIH